MAALTISDPISTILSVGSSLIDKFFPDPAAKQAAQLQLLQLQQQGVLAEMANEAGIISDQSKNIQAEASSGNWLAASWRPITMLVFVVLIAARWFGYSSPNMQEAEALELWSIVKLGLGGYVIGRSAEKIVPQVASAMKGNNNG